MTMPNTNVTKSIKGLDCPSRLGACTVNSAVPTFMGLKLESKFLSRRMAEVSSRFWKPPPASPNSASTP